MRLKTGRGDTTLSDRGMYPYGLDLGVRRGHGYRCTKERERERKDDMYTNPDFIRHGAGHKSVGGGGGFSLVCVCVCDRAMLYG